MALTDDLRSHLPAELWARVSVLLREDPREITWLRSHVQAYLYEIRATATANDHPELDYELALQCGEICQQLLDAFEGRPQSQELRLLHAMVRYYVMSEDDESDFDSMLGFDDDAMVINAVARTLSRDDLQVPVP